MFRIFVISSFVLSFTFQANASSSSVYESDLDDSISEENTQSFSAKVRIIREEDSGVDVIFADDTHPGAYSLASSIDKYGVYLRILEASRKPAGPPVVISADKEKRIQSVDKSGADSKFFGF